MRRPLATCFLALALGCGKDEAATAKAEPTAGSATVKRLELVSAPAGQDVPTIVTAELARAKTRNRRLLVYVGATWCEPCQRFHHAAEQGELDAKLSDVTFVVFDLDQDGKRLGMAGYQPAYIPYFAVPGDDGHASGQAVSGSIKGPGAVDDIVPKLEKLLGR